MAEVAMILSMANAGFKLSITLFSFAGAVRSVDKEILRTAKDISLFSQVLKLLAVTLERGHHANCISASAFETSAQIVEECRSLFAELDAVVAKSTSTKKVVRMGEDDVVAADTDKVIVPFAQRLLYFFRKAKMDTLRRNLESLKTSLQVMLSVLNFAENMTAKAESGSQPASKDPKLHASLLAQERLEMESLILANEAAVAEIRKHAKADEKHFKDWSPKVGGSSVADKASKPSITTTGIVRELVQQTSVQTTNKTGANVQLAPESLYGPTKNDGYVIQSLAPVPESLYGPTKNDGCVIQSLAPVPVVFPTLAPKIDDAKGKLEASVQDRAQVINQLLALWSPKVSTILPIDGVTGVSHRPDVSGIEKMTAEEEAEEIVELFPRRTRPY